MAIVKSKLLKQIADNYPNFLKKDLDKFTEKDLGDIKSIFNQFSDNEIYDFLTSKVAIPLEFKEIFNKILNEE